MKNSAWYTRLWHHKMEQQKVLLPADEAWKNMKQLLDQQLPVINAQEKSSQDPSTTPRNSLSGSWGQWVSLFSPAAALLLLYMITGVPMEQSNPLPNSESASPLFPTELSSTDSILPISPSPDIVNVEKGLDTASSPPRLWTTIPTQPLSTKKENFPIRPLWAVLQEETFVPDSTKKEQVLSPSNFQVSLSEAFQVFSSPSGALSVHHFHRLASKDLPSPLYDLTSEVTQSQAKRSKRDKTARNAYPVKSKGFFRNLFDLSLVENETVNQYGLKFAYIRNADPSSQLAFGGYFHRRLSPRIGLQTELLVHFQRPLEGSYWHESYFRPDSIGPFRLYDRRRITVLEMPLQVHYFPTKHLALKGGPLLSFPLQHRKVQQGVDLVPDIRDTLFHSVQITEALRGSRLSPPLQIGASVGMDFHYKRWQLGGQYIHYLEPYRVRSSLGTYRQSYQSLQLGLSYRLSKTRK